MNSRDYWLAREKAYAIRQGQVDDVFIEKETDRIYTKLLEDINKDIADAYAKYAGKEGLTFEEMKQKVDSFDVEKFKKRAAKIVKNKDFSPEANQQMRLYNLKMKVSRLELLKAQIGADMIEADEELKTVLGERLNKDTQDELHRQSGIFDEHIDTSKRTVDAVVNASFHGTTFSQKIWIGGAVSSSELEANITRGMAEGINPTKLTKWLEKYIYPSIKNKRKVAERLMRTEMSRVKRQADLEALKKMGYDEFIFIATEDSRVCDVCSGLNGKVFEVKKMLVGENAPPMHPNCRCTIAAHMDEQEYAKWLKGKENGQ